MFDGRTEGVMGSMKEIFFVVEQFCMLVLVLLTG